MISLRTAACRNTLAVAALACAGLWSGMAQATPITITFDGAVTYGFDQGGVFGAAGAFLGGEALQVQFALDSTLLGSAYHGLASAATQIVTLKGVQKTFSFDPAGYFNGSVSNSLTTASLGIVPVYLQQQAGGKLVGGGTLYDAQTVEGSFLSAQTLTDGVLGWDYLLTGNEAQRHGGFYLYDRNNAALTEFSNTIDRIRLAVVQATPSSSAVPEPTSLLLVGLPLAALVALRRRSRQRAALPTA